MMTKTTLSDGRRTRPRFAATTPTPPKFLIATFQQSKNHSTPSKQTTNPNPNSNKTRLLRPGRPRGIALLRISRPLSGLLPIVSPEGRRAQPHPRKKTSGRGFIPSINASQSSSLPFAQPHPRKPSRLSQSLGFTPFARPHPRNLDSLRPNGIVLSAFRAHSSMIALLLHINGFDPDFLPLAQPDPASVWCGVSSKRTAEGSIPYPSR